MSKYHSKKVVVDGIKFDSAREANRYAELKWLEKAGLIQSLARQQKFVLQDGYSIKDRNVRPITYIADFVYLEDGEMIVEDVKGVRTEVYKLKKKLFEKKYNIEIREV